MEKQNTISMAIFNPYVKLPEGICHEVVLLYCRGLFPIFGPTAHCLSRSNADDLARSVTAQPLLESSCPMIARM